MEHERFDRQQRRRRRLGHSLAWAFVCFAVGFLITKHNVDDNSLFITRMLKVEGGGKEGEKEATPSFSTFFSFPLQHRHGRDLLGGHLRYAAFGSGNTYGASDSLTSRYQSYPYLISEDIHNYALFSGGPNYPSACAESMVGDDHTYDVILLDYYLLAHDGLLELAKRLRTRFPHAILIFLQTWNPNMSRRKSMEYNEETFRQWFERMNVDPQHLVQALRQDENAEGVEWYFPERHQETSIQEAIAETQGHWIPLNQIENDALATLIQYQYLFDSTNQHLSAEGHEVVASHVKHTISHIRTSNSNLSRHLSAQDEASIINSVAKGTWGSGDSCHFWFTDGNVNQEIFDANDWSIVLYDEHYGKFALEIADSGYFIVKNPFDTDRTLYISFLVSSEPDMYPSTRFKGFLPPQQEVDVRPVREDKETSRLGIPKTIAIGKIKPGKTEIYVEPLQTAKHYFRLVGVSITAEEATVDEYRFAPAFNN